MPKQPYIQFYIGDYIKDTRVLPLNVKGGWVDLILAMWDNDPKGEITGTITDFSRIMNCDVAEANFVINLLKEKKIFSYEEKEKGEIRILSRKQKKMVQLAEIRKETGGQGGNPKLSTNYNKPGYVYAMQRFLDGSIKIGISTNPEKRIYKIRKQLRDQEIELIGSLFVQNMGTEEVVFHNTFIGKKKGEWFNLDDGEIKKLKILLKVNKNSPLNSPKGETKENTEYEYESESSSILNGFNTMPVLENFNGLPVIKIGAAIEFVRITKRVELTNKQVTDIWEVFKIQNITGKKYYQNEDAVYSHFLNWIKTQNFTDGSTNKSSATASGRNAGANELLQKIKRNAGV